MQLDALGAVTWVSQIFALKADRCALVRDADPLSPLSLPLNNFWLPVHPPAFLLIRMLPTAFRVFILTTFTYCYPRRVASKFRPEHKLLHFLDVVTPADDRSPPRMIKLPTFPSCQLSQVLSVLVCMAPGGFPSLHVPPCFLCVWASPVCVLDLTKDSRSKTCL